MVPEEVHADGSVAPVINPFLSVSPSSLPLESMLLLLGLSFFLGLAVEEMVSPSIERPGGIRTIPLLSLLGLALTVLSPGSLLFLIVGFFSLALWLSLNRVQNGSGGGSEKNYSLIHPVIALLAYLLGPVTLLLPHWFSISLVVVTVLTLGGRDKLHQLAGAIPPEEIFTAGKFLILAGIVWPLVPDHLVFTWLSLTPYQIWEYVVVVSSLSYASYLIQRFFSARGGLLAGSVFGGLVSSTAATVMLSKKAKESMPLPSSPVPGELHGAIVLSNSLMYLRILLVIGTLYPPMILPLLFPLVGSLLIGILMAGYLVIRNQQNKEGHDTPKPFPAHPLELTTALLFALSLMVVTVVLGWVTRHFGTMGVDLMAFLVGLTDIIPFVLGLVHQATPDHVGVVAGAIMISASSNNLAKAAYEMFILGGRRSIPSVVPLLLLAALGFLYAYFRVRL